jgi:lysophospholipid acyltransferase
VLAGLVYHPAHPEGAPPRLDLAENANMWSLETAQSPRDFINSWNIKTSHWLRRAVYSRVLPRHGAGAALVATYLASAFWHGFHPGYYLTFLSAALVLMASKTIRKRARPLVLGLGKAAPAWKGAYDVGGWVLTQVAVNYVCGPFPLVSLERGLRLWASVSYVVHVVAVLVLVADRAWPARGKRSAQARAADALDGAAGVVTEEVVEAGSNVSVGPTPIRRADTVAEARKDQ